MYISLIVHFKDYNGPNINEYYLFELFLFTLYFFLIYAACRHYFLVDLSQFHSSRFSQNAGCFFSSMLHPHLSPTLTSPARHISLFSTITLRQIVFQHTLQRFPAWSPVVNSACLRPAYLCPPVSLPAFHPQPRVLLLCFWFWFLCLSQIHHLLARSSSVICLLSRYWLRCLAWPRLTSVSRLHLCPNHRKLQNLPPSENYRKLRLWNVN